MKLSPFLTATVPVFMISGGLILSAADAGKANTQKDILGSAAM